MPVYPLTAPNTNCATPGCWCRDRVARYPCDLTDAQWDLLRPQAEQVMNDLRQASGRPMVHDLRAVLDAVFYVVFSPEFVGPCFPVSLGPRVVSGEFWPLSGPVWTRPRWCEGALITGLGWQR